jgi:hypothetical protein
MSVMATQPAQEQALGQKRVNLKQTMGFLSDEGLKQAPSAEDGRGCRHWLENR